MAVYTGKPAIVNRPAEELFERFSSPAFLKEQLKNLPQEELNKIGELRFEENRLIIVTPQVGEIAFCVKESVPPQKVVYTAEKSPVPITLAVEFKPCDEKSTAITTSIDVNIPFLAQPIVGPMMQKVTDQFSEIIHRLNA